MNGYHHHHHHHHLFKLLAQTMIFTIQPNTTVGSSSLSVAQTSFDFTREHFPATVEYCKRLRGARHCGIMKQLKIIYSADGTRQGRSCTDVAISTGKPLLKIR